MSRDNPCQVCYVIWADIGFRNAHVSVFPALAGSPPSRIYAEALYSGCLQGLIRRKGSAV